MEVGISLLFLIATCNSEHCSIQKTGELAVTNRIISWESPINTLRLEKQVNTVREELEIEDNQYQSYFFTRNNKDFVVQVPREASSITLGRGKCLEMGAKSITVQEIFSARLNERYTQVDSINFVMKTSNKTKCNIKGKEEEANCLKHIEELGETHKIRTNVSEMSKFLDKHKLGMLSVQGDNLILTTGARTILPCITEKGNTSKPAKWTILKKNYLQPKVKKAEKLLNLIKTTMEEDTSRQKRSLFSSIFGLASASETESLRQALKVELNNQQQTNKAMAELLRNQVKAAEAINKEDEILFNLEHEEAQLETKVEDMKTFLEKAFTNTTEITERLKQDVLAILKTVTINERLNNIEEQLKTILDILHCPAGNCRRVLEDIMRRENIGEQKTYAMIAKLVTVKHEKGKIEVKLHNITISDPVLTVKCIPFSRNNKSLRLRYSNEIAVNTQGFYTPRGNCMRESNIILCPEEPIYHKDKCLRDMISNQSNTGCEGQLKEDNDTIQDYISNKQELQIYSRVSDRMTMKTKTFQFETQIKTGINSYKLLQEQDYTIETSYISFKVKNHVKDKILTTRTSLDSMLSEDTHQDENLDSDKIRINLNELENIVVPILPKIHEKLDFEIPDKTLPHPALIYLSTPSESWYIWMILGGLLTLTTGAVIYCKCKKTCLFKRKQKEREDIEMREPSESESLVHTQRPKYTEMMLKNLGFTKEITSEINGKTYYWDGMSWRDDKNTLQPDFREPPSYLTAELHSYREGCEISEKDSKPYIHLKHFPETNFNKVKNVFEITMNNKTRTLPHYCAPKPSIELMQKHTRAILEAQKLKLNSPSKLDKPNNHKDPGYEIMN
jgi:hypothetical protein